VVFDEALRSGTCSVSHLPADGHEVCKSGVPCDFPQPKRRKIVAAQSRIRQRRILLAVLRLCSQDGSEGRQRPSHYVPIQTSKLPETASASAASSCDPNPQRTKDVFVAVDCINDRCRGRIFLMRAGERHSSHRPELPSLFKIVCPYCGNRQTVRRAATYYIEADATTVTLTDIL